MSCCTNMVEFTVGERFTNPLSVFSCERELIESSLLQGTNQVIAVDKMICKSESGEEFSKVWIKTIRRPANVNVGV